MKLKIVTIFASFLVLLNLVVCGTAQAQIAQVSPDKPDFTTLTPEEKTDFFSKIKNLFKPSPDDIADKMKMKEKFKPSPDDIAEKVKNSMKMKEKFKPALDDAAEAVDGAKAKLSPDDIAEKIKNSMKMKEKFKPSADDIAEKIKAKAAAAETAE
ncbi:hypothetical protein C7H19_15580 [Aphanothece hegewaldii CCALA 016]|uniref:Uncharacterized protein n=1 Tax=Aphanothece hegewaldii CCALA 016 TaxID=2107694 RepID=A0A2T1LVB8_9CHRO|nr:hypothetical protein [Aphanothece hegewaldii]PSF35662.1 hypothetical protein C7H19_15580 [Aphanothece hegewaldii CCALA 016]